MPATTTALLLLLAAVATIQQSITDNLHEEFQNFVQLDCMSDHMMIRLSYDAELYQHKMPLQIENYLKSGNFSIGSSIYHRPCHSTNNKQVKEHQYRMQYGTCGSGSVPKSYGHQESVNMYIDITPENKETMTRYLFLISCDIVEHEITSSWVEAKVSGKPVNNSGNEPVKMDLHDQLRLFIRPSIPAWGAKLQSIYSYPIQCTATSGSKKTTILDQGCPRYDAQEQVLSAIYQATADRYLAKATELFLITIPQLFPQSDEKNATLSLECTVMWCTTLLLERVQGLPLCPSASPCESFNGAQPFLKAGKRLPLHSARLPFSIEVNLNKQGSFAPEFKAVRLPEFPSKPNPCALCEMSTLEVLAWAGVLVIIAIAVLGMILAALICVQRRNLPRRSPSGIIVTSSDAEALCKSSSS